MRAPLSKDPSGIKWSLINRRILKIWICWRFYILPRRSSGKNVKWFYVFDREKRRGSKRRDDSTNVGVSEDLRLFFVIRCWKRIKMKCTNWNNCVALISKSFDQVSGALYVFSIERGCYFLSKLLRKEYEQNALHKLPKLEKLAYTGELSEKLFSNYRKVDTGNFFKLV